ncbi:hypothetical protein QLX67_04335 [Balneolaceae bacterium ANBcel3]|nr:hypothetical protein [Balneolaceae bacterium ANBcel3]
MSSDSLLLRLGFLTFFIFFCISASHATPHRSFGVYYPGDSAKELNTEDILWLKDIGFSWVMVEKELTSDQLIALSDAQFSVFVLVPEFFSIPSRILKSGRNYTERVASLIGYYDNHVLVKGFGLLAYSNWNRPELVSYFQSLSDAYPASSFFILDSRPHDSERVQPLDGVLLQTRSAERLNVQLKKKPKLAGILYDPLSNHVDLRDLEQTLSLLEAHRNLPVFFNKEWFFAHASRDSYSGELTLSQLTTHYAHFEDAKVATHSPKTRINGTSLSTIFLFLFWIAFAAYYRLNPIYRKSVHRFFLNYDFFVNDILMRRIRLPGNAVGMYFVTCTLAGLLAFSTADFFLDNIGLSALLRYLPIINPSWSHPFFTFLFFFFIAAVINGIYILWLWIANNKHAQMHQIAVFLLWPHHLSILLITLGIILLQSIPSGLIAATMFVAYWGITIASFFLTAYNMRRIQPTSPVYMASTYALFSIVTTILIGWLIFILDLAEAWLLAISLSAF